MPRYLPYGSASTSSTPTCVPATPSMSENAFEQHVLNYFKKLHKQFKDEAEIDATELTTIYTTTKEKDQTEPEVKKEKN
ncbi:hypothetical protein PVK06_024812 [Gossypium arboreum]|uniref:Uncharacterized protein n=1 Tax=Gossypium arboreum TaxID=29729 RepID=A0ABR0PEY4_GOSAR|nr:hypothetical protein PVK06_024812 [Gossypium arboreum]